jgi:hypothetical protein
VPELTAKPYTRTLQDELDWKLVDQLYGVVSQISGFCFDIKKFCVTTEFVVLTFVAKFTKDKLDDSVFVAGLLMAVCFWFLDATAYYYQVKLRGTMDSIRERIKKRDDVSLLTVDAPRIIAPERVDVPFEKRLRNAAINHSMWLYALLVSIDLVAWSLFHNGGIK